MSSPEAKNRIIAAVRELIAEGEDLHSITIRQVAERAKVSIGLINYHFDSKDDLLSIAISGYMAEMASGYAAPGVTSDLNPAQQLKAMLKNLYHFAAQHEQLMTFTITQNLLRGEMQTPLFLVPLLKQVFGDEKDDMQLRIIALQILFPLQIASINPAAFLLYAGIDLHDEPQRNHLIDLLVDQLLKR